MGRAEGDDTTTAMLRVAIAFSPRAGHAFEATLELPAPATAFENS